MSYQYNPNLANTTNTNSPPVKLLTNTFDPSRQPQFKPTFQQKSNLPPLPPPPTNYPQPSGTQSTPIRHNVPQQVTKSLANSQNYTSGNNYGAPTNTSLKNVDENYEKSLNVGKINSNIGNNTTNNFMVEKISERIYNHFKNKYPETIDASGFNKYTIKVIVEKTTKREPLNEKSISKIIDIIDHKFRMTINGENRQGKQFDTTTFSMDNDSKIPIEKYLENFTNKISILQNSDKAIEADLPKKMGPVNDMIDLKEPERFSEDFPSRDKENKSDMLIPEVRSFDFYVMINSNDRNISKNPDPNNFIIDFGPAPSGDSPQKGYIDRTFHNIKSCELLNVVILDTSNTAGSSFNGNSYPYLMLQFDELQNNYFGTNSALSRTFAILTDYYQVGNYRYYRMVGESSEYTVTKIFNPRINLPRLTTKLLLPDGTPVNFGDSYKDDTTSSCISFALRVSTVQRNLATSYMNNA
jgi:hypothetical protein